jgi:hypothetical protein
MDGKDEKAPQAEQDNQAEKSSGKQHLSPPVKKL